MRNYSTILCLFSLLLTTQTFAQRPEGTPPVKITGKIYDKETTNPLEYATITLFSKQDSSLITGTVTDVTGSFELEATLGNYFAKVEFIAYQAFVIEQIPFQRGVPVVDLGKISISPDATVLEEVEVRAEKSSMQMSLDKRVFNVGKDLANQGGTAVEILDNVPSVTVDVEGNVSLRGAGGVRILVDGKPSGLISADNPGGLRGIPANMIDRIEVITNPSARYEAEGTTGIINIILKKDKQKGFNGSFDVNVGIPDNYGVAGNVNYRRKDLNFFANYGIRYQESPGFSTNYIESFRNGINYITDQSSDRVRSGINNNLRLGADYFISPKDILTTAFSYRIGGDNNFTELRYLDYENTLDNLTGIVLRTDDETEDDRNLEYALTYDKQFEKEGHKLVLDVRYQDNGETEGSDFIEKYSDAKGSITRPDLSQRSNNDESETVLLLRSDYVYPFAKEGKFELGYLGSIRRINNDYLVEQFQDEAWTKLQNLSNDFNYIENIHAAYTSIGNKIDKFSFQFGLRAEYSQVRTELLETNQINDREYANLFPSIFFTYDLPAQNAVQISYSRRIRRPGFRELNPFFTFSDSRNLFSGNPNLDPEFTNSFDLGHIKYWEKGSLSSSVYYRHTNNVIDRILAFDTLTGNTIRRPENIAENDSYGFEFTYSYNPFKWWRISGDLNFFRSITKGEVIDANNELQQLDADALSWFGRVTSRTTVLKGLDIQLRGNYRAPQNTTQGRSKSLYSLDVAASKDILKNRATLTLSVQDMFNSRRYRAETFGDGFYSNSDFQWRARQTVLTFSYRLNQDKKRARGRGEGGGYYGGEGGEF
ncbi:MAG: TonB-dependent receptor [Saprospiraceae bacterium]|nr:TonB-dependent receptor [Saprospiraceae bacterium]